MKRILYLKTIARDFLKNNAFWIKMRALLLLVFKVKRIGVDHVGQL